MWDTISYLLTFPLRTHMEIPFSFFLNWVRLFSALLCHLNFECLFTRRILGSDFKASSKRLRVAFFGTKPFPKTRAKNLKWVSETRGKVFVEHFLEAHNKGGERREMLNEKPNFLSSSQPLELIKKPFNFIVMWLAIKYITSIYQYMSRKGSENRQKRNLKAHRKSDKNKSYRN